MPEIEFINSPKSERKRWKETRKVIVNAWYEKHGFLILPELIKEINPQIQVIFPKVIDHQPIDLVKFQKGWEEVEAEFWAELDHYLPEARTLHTHVQVDVGRIGTISSSYWTSSHYYLRSDRSVGDLGAMIVNRVLYEKRKSLGVTWTKREALMDFIMTTPVMVRLFPHFKPVFSQLSRVPMKWRRQSEKYVQELGIAKAKNEVEIVQGRVLIKGILVGKELTKKEKLVIKLLIEHLGDLVTYDELADAVWGVGEFKSFWAINKLIERTRPKLKALGIDGTRILSVRGQGYLLN